MKKLLLLMALCLMTTASFAGNVHSYLFESGCKSQVAPPDTLFASPTVDGITHYDNPEDEGFIDFLKSNPEVEEKIANHLVDKYPEAFDMLISTKASEGFLEFKMRGYDRLPEVSLIIFNRAGEAVYDNSHKLTNGFLYKQLDVEGLRPGTYMMIVSGENFTETKKLVIP